MPRPSIVTSSAILQTEFVTLSCCGFAFWWALILVVHLFTFVYNACYAKFYWDFGTQVLSYSVELYDVGLAREHFNTIAYVHMVLSVIHSAFLLLMLLGSLRFRTLKFYPWPDLVNKTDELKNVRDCSRQSVGCGDWISTVSMHIISMYATSARRLGVFGVNGRYFYVILICREFVETSFQTVQAVRMSQYLPRGVLNRFYVSLLVINCWSSVLTQTLFGQDEARRRFIAIICDCALDLMSSMGVSIMIVSSYVDDFDPQILSFKLELLGNDEWMARMISEARLVLVSSWSDLISRVVFSMGIILTTANIKKLLRWRSTGGNRVHHVKELTRENNQHLTPVEIISPSFTSRSNKAGGFGVCFVKRMKCLAYTLVHCVFIAWGATVLALHIQASHNPPLAGCNPKVNPMAAARPACFAVKFNCYELGISGRKEEVEAHWIKIDQSSVVKLHIAHCPELEVPDIFNEFALLHEIWLYNSSIASWNSSASFTNKQHPNLKRFSLVRTNMTNGQLPLGFQSYDFPTRINQISFYETNLQTLPDDLDSKWKSSFLIVYIENSQLAEVPLSLVRLQPYVLSLAGNPITEFPPEIFEDNGIQYLFLSRTKLRVLSRNIMRPPRGPLTIDLADTGVSFFWSWIDPLVEGLLQGTLWFSLAAGGSPYCEELDNIMNGVSTEFSASPQPSFSQYLMNTSEANWDILRQAVDCSPHSNSTEYYLKYWDMLYAMP